MEKRLKSKSTSFGLVEVVQCGSDYRLYVAGELKCYSSDLDYIMREFDRY